MLIKNLFIEYDFTFRYFNNIFFAHETHFNILKKQTKKNLNRRLKFHVFLIFFYQLT